MRHEYQVRFPMWPTKIKFYIGDVRSLQSFKAMPCRRGLHLPRRRSQTGAFVRVLPHGGRKNKCDRHRQCAPLPLLKAGVEAVICPFYRQGCIPNQRYGYQQRRLRKKWLWRRAATRVRPRYAVHAMAT